MKIDNVFPHLQKIW